MSIEPHTLGTPDNLSRARAFVDPEAARGVKSLPRTGNVDPPEDDQDRRSLFQRYRLGLALVLVILIIVGLAIKMSSGTGSPPRRELSLVVVNLPPPPPPSPPPQAPSEPTMVEQQTFEPEEKPQEEPPQPPDQPPLGTNIKGDGRADGFGLSGAAGTGLGNGGNGGTRFGWYAGQVQAKIEEALRNNRKTRSADMTIQVRIWPDKTGRIARAQLAGSTGDPALDTTLRSEVFSGLQLREPPPADMPLPIVLRLTARRPK